MAAVIGTAMLVVPMLFGASPSFQTAARALHLPGWLLLCFAALLAGLHMLRSRNHGKPKAVPGTSKLPPFDGRMDKAMVPHRPAEIWGSEVFNAIEWRRFEAVCEQLFAQAGFETQSQSHGADGGVDIWLYSKNTKGPAALAQCKHWRGKPVGVKEMREFFGVMASHKLARGTYATSSTFTADALAFAKANGINAKDGAGLLGLIAKRTPEQQQALLDTAYEGEYWRPTCASCGVKMVERTPARGSAMFWGCANFPRCRNTIHMASTA